MSKDFTVFTPNDFTYHQDTTWLDKIINSKWWRRKKIRSSAYKTAEEVRILRRRCYALAVECAEWRLKVGGAAYPMAGNRFAQEVYRGMQHRGAVPVRLADDDFSRRPK